MQEMVTLKSGLLLRAAKERAVLLLSADAPLSDTSIAVSANEGVTIREIEAHRLELLKIVEDGALPLF